MEAEQRRPGRALHAPPVCVFLGWGVRIQAGDYSPRFVRQPQKFTQLAAIHQRGKDHRAGGLTG